jgi:outer membrane protein OmpA-like peptidoglycan-associated protein
VTATSAQLASPADGPSNASLVLSETLRAPCNIGLTPSERRPPTSDFDGNAVLPGEWTVLAEVAKCLTTGPLHGRNVTLVGRGDSRGTLGSGRSTAVLSSLVALGLPRAQMRESSRGPLDLTQADDERAREADRRVDVDLVPTTP